ncbi:hypothetical protein HPB47_019642 [Ixodes persulcatus]|uniref:Uncharacterized protein n=1 Tax=Ixodes persulcatus TaxID=34615 RepID=A0AC60QHL7_IXOPE|nr:hypothetical protein HPB47_019642 [Ixodes persulcatus]
MFGNVEVKVLVYADDGAILCCNKKSVAKVVELTREFCDAAGAAANWDKCCGFRHGFWATTPSTFEGISWTCMYASQNALPTWSISRRSAKKHSNRLSGAASVQRERRHRRCRRVNQTVEPSRNPAGYAVRLSATRRGQGRCERRRRTPQLEQRTPSEREESARESSGSLKSGPSAPRVGPVSPASAATEDTSAARVAAAAAAARAASDAMRSARLSGHAARCWWTLLVCCACGLNCE